MEHQTAKEYLQWRNSVEENRKLTEKLSFITQNLSYINTAVDALRSPLFIGEDVDMQDVKNILDKVSQRVKNCQSKIGR